MPIHGSLQGSGNDRTEWCNISVPTLQTYDELTEGCTIQGPTKNMVKIDHEFR